jgi:iron complex outermembrane recepter protein
MRRLRRLNSHPRQHLGVPGAALMMMAALTATTGLAAGHVHAAAPPVQQQIQNDTVEVIPLAPLSVSVLRVPFATDTAPMAVSALAEGDLRRGRSGMFLDEALMALPGVQVQNRYNPAVGERVVIRGFGGGASANFGVRGIRVIVDGIPATLPDGQTTLDHLDIGSLGRVEAVRGPASSLFGNASGGVLAFTTRAPASSPFEGDLEVLGGSHGMQRAQVSASGTVEDTGYFFTLSSQSWDGYRNVLDDSPRADTVGTHYGSSDRIGFNARVTRPMAGGELAFTANVLDIDAENAGSITNDFRDDPDLGVNDLYLRFRTGKEVSQQQGGVRWAGPLGEGAWSGDFSVYGVRRSVLNPIPFNVIDLSRRGGGLRSQFGYQQPTGLGQLRLQMGVDVDFQDDDRTETAAPFGAGRPPEGASPSVNQDEAVRNTGVFLQGNLDLAAGAVAMVGLRYDRQRFEVTDFIPPSEGNPDDSGSRTMESFSPSVGVSFPIVDWLSGFSSIGTVFETPTTTAFKNQPGEEGGFNQELDPTTGTSYEVGVRGSIATHAAFEVTTYWTNLENELVAFEIEGAEGATFLRNAGASRHRGVEATVSMVDRSGHLRTTLAYAFTDARFRDFVVGDEDLADNRLPAVAPHRLQARVRFEPGSWFAELGASYVDVVQANDQNTASAPAHSLLDLRAGLRNVSVGNVELSPWVAVSNLLDESYITSVVVNATGNRYFEPGPTRTFQMGLRTTWGPSGN